MGEENFYGGGALFFQHYLKKLKLMKKNNVFKLKVRSNIKT